MTPFTRREFTKLALAALPAAGLLSALNSARAADVPAQRTGKPNSKVNGVQIGLNVPYSFGNLAMSGDDILAACIQLNVNGLELRTQPVEAFLGAPANLLARGRVEAIVGRGTPATPPAPGRGAAGNPDGLRAWRAGADVAGAAAFRKQYEDAGMLIEIVKVDNMFHLGDAELDYIFTLGKTLGARALSTEISANEEDHARLGQFADKHRMMVGIHGHTKTGPDNWEKAIAHSKYIGINLDLGHFVAGNNMSPVEYIKKRHDRITHVHIKDKKMNDGPNTPLGQGDTPIVEVLHMIRDNKWPMQATIEFEYDVPKGSTRMIEIAKCMTYCRDALA